MRLWLAIFALCGSVGGQSTARLEGRVVSQTGEPLGKVTVRLQTTAPGIGGQVTQYLEVSDNAGKFVFESVPPGRYALFPERTGFSRVRTGDATPTIALQAGEVKKDVEIKLIQRGVISGRITDQDGDPVFEAPVRALRVQYDGTRRYLTAYAEATSDDQENFRILNLEPGRYYPMADNPRPRANLGTAEHRGRSAQNVEILTYYPSSPDFGGALAVDVGAGAEVRGVNIRMVKARVFSIRGKTVDSRSGAPTVAHLGLIPKGTDLDRLNGKDEASASSDTGAFEFGGLRAGTYILQASPDTRGLTGRMEVTVANADVEGLVFALYPPPEITGTVRIEDGDLGVLQRPPDFAALNRRPTGAGPRIVLSTFDVGGPMEAAGQVAADGTFKIQNFTRSVYTVHVDLLPPGTYIKSIRFGGQDAMKTPLDLTAGTGGVLEVLLSQKVAEVNATVHGDATAGISVTMWSKSPTLIDPLFRRAFRTGPDGTVRLTDMPPGEYYVAAWETNPNLTIPDFLARFTGLATPIKLAENDKAMVDLTLIPKDKIAAEIAKLP